MVPLMGMGHGERLLQCWGILNGWSRNSLAEMLGAGLVAARWVDVGTSQTDAQIGFKFNICPFPVRLFVNV